MRLIVDQFTSSHTTGLTRRDSLVRVDFIALAVIFALGMTLRLIRLFDIDLIFDEAVLLLQIKESFAGIWNLCKTDNFPPLYPWMIKIWMQIASGYNWFRIFGALMAALTPPAAYLLGREVSGRKLGWALGLMCILSPILLYYSQFVRMYNFQPFCVIISVYWFLKAMKTGFWRYWLLVALANLVGFYVYVFMSFIFVAELLVLIYYFRWNLKQYLRPAVSQLPFLIGAMIWMIPTMARYPNVQKSFWTPPFSLNAFMLTCLHLGMGVNFRDAYWLVEICLLPLLLGIFMWFRLKPRNREIDILVFVALFANLCLFLISLGKRSFYHDRYLVFILPLYLAAVLYGLFNIPKPRLRRWAVIAIFTVYSAGTIYYFADYYFTHIYVGIIRDAVYLQPGEGHGLSMIASDVAKNIKPDEVIIHYSAQVNVINSYFSMLVYHHRALPEYIFSPTEIEQHNGAQYLRPGDWIKSLHDLNTLPAGIWLVTLSPVKDITGEIPPVWVLWGNLPEELAKAGYKPVETITHFKASAIHYVRQNDSTTQ